MAVASGANMNFDRLRLVSELAQVGARREAMLATTIPEVAHSVDRIRTQLNIWYSTCCCPLVAWFAKPSEVSVQSAAQMCAQVKSANARAGCIRPPSQNHIPFRTLPGTLCRQGERFWISSRLRWPTPPLTSPSSSTGAHKAQPLPPRVPPCARAQYGLDSDQSPVCSFHPSIACRRHERRPCAAPPPTSCGTQRDMGSLRRPRCAPDVAIASFILIDCVSRQILGGQGGAHPVLHRHQRGLRGGEYGGAAEAARLPHPRPLRHRGGAGGFPDELTRWNQYIAFAAVQYYVFEKSTTMHSQQWHFSETRPHIIQR